MSKETPSAEQSADRYLIERAPPGKGAFYYAGFASWTTIPDDALHFPTRKAAELRSFGMAALGHIEIKEFRDGRVIANG